MEYIVKKDKNSKSNRKTDNKFEHVDPRIIRTKEKFYQSLSYLLEEKTLDQITVSELTESAGINRSTFYLHYSNVAELYEEVKNLLISEYRRTINNFHFGNEVSDQENEKILLVETFNFIIENKAYISFFLVRQNEDDVLQKLISLGEEIFIRTISARQTHLSDKEIFYYYTFMVNGIIAIIRNWVNEGMKEKPIDMANMILNFIYR